LFEPMRSLRARLSSGDCIDAVWLSLGSIALCEIAARSRPGVVVIDMQHGLWERPTLEAAIGIASAHAPVMVRIADHSAPAISQALDAGAEGILAPLVETAAQAADIALAARFPPTGIRSGGGVRPLHDFVAYVEEARQKTVVGVMIETRAGLAQADAIAAAANIDLVFIGTGDLALSLGEFPRFGHAHQQACATIRNACEARGLACGAFTASIEGARQMREQGYRMVVTANDIDIARVGFAEAAHQFAESAAPASQALLAQTADHLGGDRPYA